MYKKKTIDMYWGTVSGLENLYLRETGLVVQTKQKIKSNSTSRLQAKVTMGRGGGEGDQCVDHLLSRASCWLHLVHIPLFFHHPMQERRLHRGAWLFPMLDKVTLGSQYLDIYL